jgi:hypothetical protein
MSSRETGQSRTAGYGIIGSIGKVEKKTETSSSEYLETEKLEGKQKRKHERADYDKE